MAMNNKTHLVWLLVVILAACALPICAWQAAGSGAFKISDVPFGDKALSAAHRSVVFDSLPFSPGSTVPYWEKGYLISKINVEISGPNRPVVALYDANGAKVREASSVWFPGSVRVAISNAAVTPDGRIMISGSAEKTDGTWASFIAWTNLVGTLVNVIQTNPFGPLLVCSAPDGTAWSFGYAKDPNEPILRHFDPVKGQIAAHLPRLSFPGRFSPAINGGEGKHVYLRCSSEKLAIYSELADEYLEMDYATETVQRWPIDRTVNDVRVDGFAVMESGDVYVVANHFSDQPGHFPMFQLQIDRPAGKIRWLRVAGAAGNEMEPSQVRSLLGADHESLVYLKMENWPTVYWARPVATGTSETAKR
jgi:hypothetical protein